MRAGRKQWTGTGAPFGRRGRWGWGPSTIVECWNREIRRTFTDFKLSSQVKSEKCRVVSRYLPQSKDVDLKCRVVSRHLPTIRVSRENICISQRPRQTATHQLTVGLAHIVLRADGPASTHLCTFLHNNWESFAQICMRKSRRVCYILHFWGTFLQSRVATLAYECCAETDWRVSGCGVA